MVADSALRICLAFAVRSGYLGLQVRLQIPHMLFNKIAPKLVPNLCNPCTRSWIGFPHSSQQFPLRKRNVNPGARVAPIFPIITPFIVSDCGGGQVVANCSGDPLNCAACADDSFGQAFCTAVGESLAVNGNERCANCPGRATPGANLPEIAAAAAADACCGRKTDGGCCRDQARIIAAPQPTMPSTLVASGTIPCNQAWQQIKAHPNASFADLRLLADVVARRSKCTGPRVVISPAPGTATPDRKMSPHLKAVNHASLGQPRKPREHEIHIQCGRPSVRELPAEAVRDALRLLEIMQPQH